MNSIKHVAIIMDGNGRWGIKHKKSRNLGHKEGLKTVEKIIKTTIKNKKKSLRDAPAASAIDDADTIEKLKAAWDTSLLGTSPYA